jgi:flagellin
VQLQAEISRVATTTQFGGLDLLTGGFSAQFLVGANAGQNISVNLSTVDGASFGASGLGVGTTSVETPADASAALASVDAAISSIGSTRAELGALQNRFQSTIRNLSNISENVSSARSAIRDTDFAVETAELTRNQIIQQSSLSILGQANQRPQAALSLLG